MEELCSSCPLRDYRLGALTGEELVERYRGHADVEAERTAIIALTAGEVILDALDTPRPERCTTLDEILPGQHFRRAYRKRWVPVSACPEMALAAVIDTDFPKELAEIE